MRDFLHILAFSFNVTGPIFAMLAIGVVLRRRGALSDAFIDNGSRLVYTLALPAMLFTSVAQTRLSEAGSPAMILYGVLAMIVFYIAFERLADRIVEPARDRGVVVLGAFRSNKGIIGLAYTVNAYGDEGLRNAALYVGVLSILFNVLSVITLNRSLARVQSRLALLRNILGNPLIIGILLALPISIFGLTLPAPVLKTAQYFADLTLPLALICVGASLDFALLRAESRNTLLATFAKLVVLPLGFTAGAWALGFRGIELGILLLMACSPSASVNYIMARALGGNATLAANTIALTTLGSLFTTSLGVMLLRGAGLM